MTRTRIAVAFTSTLLIVVMSNRSQASHEAGASLQDLNALTASIAQPTSDADTPIQLADHCRYRSYRPYHRTTRFYGGVYGGYGGYGGQGYYYRPRYYPGSYYGYGNYGGYGYRGSGIGIYGQRGGLWISF